MKLKILLLFANFFGKRLKAIFLRKMSLGISEYFSRLICGRKQKFQVRLLYLLENLMRENFKACLFLNWRSLLIIAILPVFFNGLMGCKSRDVSVENEDSERNSAAANEFPDDLDAPAPVETSAFPWPPEGRYTAVRVGNEDQSGEGAGSAASLETVSFEMGKSEILEMRTFTWEGEQIFERSDVEYEEGANSAQQVKSFEAIKLSKSNLVVSLSDKVSGRELTIELELEPRKILTANGETIDSPLPVAGKVTSQASKASREEAYDLKDIKYLGE